MLLLFLKYTLIQARIAEFERNVAACKLYTELVQYDSTINKHSTINKFININLPALIELNTINIKYDAEYNKHDSACEYKLVPNVS